VSWVPFIEVSHEAGESASVTTRWRIEVWRQALRMLPDYWLLGRGFASEASGIHAIDNLLGLDRDQVGAALVAHNYHNGPLGVLLDLGVFGLVLVLAMLVIGAVRYYRLTQHPWRDSYLAWLHKLVLAKFLTSFVIFLFIYGDTRTMLPDLLLTMVFLECMTDSLRKDGDAKTALPVASTET